MLCGPVSRFSVEDQLFTKLWMQFSSSWRVRWRRKPGTSKNEPWLPLQVANDIWMILVLDHDGSLTKPYTFSLRAARGVALINTFFFPTLISKAPVYMICQTYDSNIPPDTKMVMRELRTVTSDATGWQKVWDFDYPRGFHWRWRYPGTGIRICYLKLDIR